MADSDEPTSTRERLILAAREAFMREGYRASMDAIAAQAGVAKQTLYNHFPCKAELFGEVAAQASADIVVALDDDGKSLQEVLRSFGRNLRKRALGEEGLAIFRALTAEGLRFPEMNRTFFASGPSMTIGRLTAYLKRAMDAGSLRRDDPRFAAEMLMGMLMGVDHARRLCLVEAPEEDEDARIARMVEVFLRAFGPTNDLRGSENE